MFLPIMRRDTFVDLKVVLTHPCVIKKLLPNLTWMLPNSE